MDETETDVDILMECLKYQNGDFQAVKRSLQALASVFNDDGDSKEYFRRIGGLHLVYKLLSADVPDYVLQAALFCLACAIENDVFCQNMLTKVEMFEFLHKVLTEKKRDKKWLQAAIFLVANLVGNNSVGQKLTKESGVLADLLSIFRQCAEKRRQSSGMCMEDVGLCLSVIPALSLCVNNPRNEVNQRLCCTILPLCFQMVVEDKCRDLTGSLLSFASLTIAGNGFNQKRVKTCGGLDILLQLMGRCAREVNSDCSLPLPALEVINAINACISDHKENSSHFLKQGGVQTVMKWLDGPHQLSPQHLLRLMLTLGHALEHADRTAAPLTPHHQSLLVQLLTDSDDEEVVRAIKYVLSTWQHLGKREQVCGNRGAKTETVTTMQRIDRLASQLQRDEEKMVLCDEDEIDQKDEERVDHGNEMRMDQGEEMRMDRGEEVRNDQGEEVGMDQGKRVKVDQGKKFRMDASEERSDRCGEERLEQDGAVVDQCKSVRLDSDEEDQSVPQHESSIDQNHKGSCRKRPLFQFPLSVPQHAVTTSATSQHLCRQDSDAARRQVLELKTAGTSAHTLLPYDNNILGHSLSAAPRSTEIATYDCRPYPESSSTRSQVLAPISAQVCPQNSSLPFTGSVYTQAVPSGEEKEAYNQYVGQAVQRQVQTQVVSLSAGDHSYLGHPGVAGYSLPLTTRQPFQTCENSHPHAPQQQFKMLGNHHIQQPFEMSENSFPLTVQQPFEKSVNSCPLTSEPQPVVTPSHFCAVTNIQGSGQGGQIAQHGTSASLAPCFSSLSSTAPRVSLTPCVHCSTFHASHSSAPCQTVTGYRETLLPAACLPHAPLGHIHQSLFPHGRQSFVEQRSASSSMPAVGGQSLGFQSTPVPPAAAVQENRLGLAAYPRQQDLSTVHHCKQTMLPVTGVASMGSCSSSSGPAVQTLSTSEWQAGIASLQNSGGGVGQGYPLALDQHHQHPAFLHSLNQPVLSQQSAVSAFPRSPHILHPGEPSVNVSFMPPNTHGTSETSRLMSAPAAVDQQERCVVGLHDGQNDQGNGTVRNNVENRDTVCNMVNCPSPKNSATIVATHLQGSSPLLAVKQSPPLITDICETAGVSEDIQSTGTRHNAFIPIQRSSFTIEDSRNVSVPQYENRCISYRENMCVENCGENCVAQHSVCRAVVPENKMPGERPQVVMSSGTFSAQSHCSPIPGKSVEKCNQSSASDAVTTLKHDRQEDVFRVPFPPKTYLAGGEGSVESNVTSHSAGSGVYQSPCLSAGSGGRRTLRRAASRTPVTQLGKVVTPATQSVIIGRDGIVCNTLKVSDNVMEGTKIHQLVSTKQISDSHMARQYSISTKHWNGLRSAEREFTYLVPPSPAASEFDCQLLKTAADPSCLVHQEDDRSACREIVPDSEASDDEEGDDHVLDGLSHCSSADTDDCLSETASHLSGERGMFYDFPNKCGRTFLHCADVYSVSTECLLSLQAAVGSGNDVCKACPGCSSGAQLTSRTFNIAIETSGGTCPSHRKVRQLERDYIQKRTCMGQRYKKLGHLGQIKVVKKTQCSCCSDNCFNKDKPVQAQQPVMHAYNPSLSMCEERRLKRAVAKLGHDWPAILRTGQFALGRTAEELHDHWRILCKHSKRSVV